ncbi:MAG: ribosome silencing factor, partial [Candidatus Dadabacteria bacterium]|nr:ribosome silencing factor [Candidatus Dadabacteria bacterium]
MSLQTGGEAIESREKALFVARVAWEKKAEVPVILDVGEKSDVANYLVVCSANSDRGVRTIVESVGRELKKREVKILGTEGLQEGRWVLLDLVDVVLHVFYRPLREFYD